MNIVRRLFITLFSLFLILSVQGQSLDELIGFARQKYTDGQYRLAAREFQRALFFGPKERVGELQILTGDCYFEAGEYELAEKYYRFASTLQLADSLHAESVLKKASCQLLNHQYRLALIDLYRISPASSPGTLRKKQILLGVAYFGLEEFENSRMHFEQSMDGMDTASIAAMETLFQDRRLLHPKPKLAFWLSVVLPGSGQFYAGDIKNGLNSMVLSLGLAVLTFRMATLYSVWDALLTVFPWWQRYYIGGYNSAEKIASARRDRNRANVFRLIYAEVMGSE